ncbi:hypothetical protein [Sorangium cellulosum]|uniref:Uncharacterized protein n=1 Tax=Sorangium cellulosum So0157-2 TaxID=1254432 RepID=S4XZS1_SORCE|nr:hypothetical protein [Sorangium cellulosum]AGP38732.1 hypothetical protein SCE1572_32155 [Sorangium cellulosum So0157-2]
MREVYRATDGVRGLALRGGASELSDRAANHLRRPVQADVSTINNEVRYYYNETFDSAFQDRRPSGNPDEGGWWNPTGSGAFRLVDCKVTSAWHDGAWVTDPAKDPAIGLLVANALGRSAGKMVDLDPQMQMASGIWGMGVRLTDGTGPGYVAGDFWPACFRDLTMRQEKPRQNGQPLGASYTSVLQNLVWNPSPTIASRVLEQIRRLLQQHGPEAALSIHFNLYNYCRNYDHPEIAKRYTFGDVVGAIGVALPGEPKSFVLGRRFAPTKRAENPHASAYFDAVVDMASGTVSVDLGNALPLDEDGQVQTNLGRMSLVVLAKVDTVANGQPTFLPEGSDLSDGDFDKIGDLPYADPDWMTTTAGIVSLALPAAALALVADHPLAIVTPKQRDLLPPTFTIWARETVMGYHVRADEFVQRLNPQSQVPDPQPTDSADVTVYAAQWGKPFNSAGLHVEQLGPTSLGTGAQQDIKGIEVPWTGLPAEVVTQSQTRFFEGRAVVTVTATDPAGARLVYYYTPPPNDKDPLPTPAKQPTPLVGTYMDGQIYSLIYKLQETSDWELYKYTLDPSGARTPPAQQHYLDYVDLHVRDGYAAKLDPTWQDVAPIFSQYANLYPVMSRRLVDLSDEQSVAAHAASIELAFSLDMSDPNYMPVTRDMSPAKQQTVLAYLRKVQGKPAAAPESLQSTSAPRPVGAPIPVVNRDAAAARTSILSKSKQEPGHQERRRVGAIAQPKTRRRTPCSA